MGEPVEQVNPVPESLFAEGDLSTWARPRLAAVRRRWLRVLVVAVLFVGSAIAALKVWPRSYRASSVLFALPADEAPGSVRGPSGGTQGLAQGAAEVITTRASLRELVRELDLVPSWEASRQGAAAWLDRAEEWLGVGTSADTPEDRALDALADRLTVKVDHAEVTVTAEWPDPQLAYEIANRASSQLIALRRETEIAPLEAKASTLAEREKADGERVEGEVASLTTLMERKRKGARPSTVRGLQAEGRFRDLPDPKLSQLREKLIAERRAIADLEEVRQKRLAELTSALAEQSATLGPQNPKVLDTKDQLLAIKDEEAQLEGLKQDERALLAEFVREGGNERELTSDPVPLFAPELKEDDQALAFRREALSIQLQRLQDLRSQALEARLAVSAAQASFTGRYVELESPRVPHHPASPKRILVCLSALLAGLFFGSLWAISAELGRAPAALGVARS